MKQKFTICLAILVAIFLLVSPLIFLEIQHFKKLKTVLSLNSEFTCGLVDKEESSFEKIYKNTIIFVRGSSFGARRDISELTLKNRYFLKLLAKENSQSLLKFFMTHKILKDQESYSVFSWKNSLIQRLWLMDRFNLYCKKTKRTLFDWGSNEFWIHKESGS